MSLNGGLRFGVVQGRLTKAPPGQLQWFPQGLWESEFPLASALGVDYIELIAERNHNPDNPIWSADGTQRIKAIAARQGLSLHAICNDYVIDHALPRDHDVLDQNLRLIDRGALLGCDKLILPLFESSELTLSNATRYTESIRVIADKAADSGMTVCLETVLNGHELIEVLDRLGHPAVSVVYDTGNRTTSGHEVPDGLRALGHRISHVHIKDKNATDDNVILGTGVVNFQHVFEALAAIDYVGPYTLETPRGRNPSRTATYSMEFVKYFHAEYFAG